MQKEKNSTPSRDIIKRHQDFYLRPVTAASDREIEVLDPLSGRLKKMLMFGSNNYLGFANDPFIREEVRKSMETFVTGIGGQPFSSGRNFCKFSRIPGRSA